MHKLLHLLLMLRCHLGHHLRRMLLLLLGLVVLLLGIDMEVLVRRQAAQRW